MTLYLDENMQEALKELSWREKISASEKVRRWIVAEKALVAEIKKKEQAKKK